MALAEEELATLVYARLFVVGQFEFWVICRSRNSRVAGPLAGRSASKLAGYTGKLKLTQYPAFWILDDKHYGR